MDLRRRVGCTELTFKTRYDYGNTRLRIFNAKHGDLADDPNDQSVVIKVVQRNAANDIDYDSVLLTGDTSAVTWKHIRRHYDAADLSCSLLLASHHGSLTYFDDPADKERYHTSHLKEKSPAMTIISVGDNSFGHPHPKSLKFYETHCSGSNQGNRICRTDVDGNISLVLKNGGGWSLTRNT